MQSQLNSNFYPVWSWRFWRAFIIHMRPYLCLYQVWPDWQAWRSEGTGYKYRNILMAFIPFFLGYGFGQALTDCFQIDTDTISAPYRPLVKKKCLPDSRDRKFNRGLF